MSRPPALAAVIDMVGEPQRIAELEAKLRWHEEGSNSIVGYPWDTPYMDGIEQGKRDCREATAELEAECLEQARLLGMSAEREARLLARIQDLERRVAELVK